ncbi:HAMP domain-containing histidine kinase [Mycolicibacterium flavescens]|uniref:histidine kinase n=1 Tax=Mycolicibacterium flavescens TaxID=1776 RepID=A0A1E3RKB3_MYCFV|nr:HAMP domain-containing sensor histidine kinase [Mycolicibacterium flavescens]MCV7281013.1 HAMP domain-containing histidine kinase [Mycolicibacterium flavescens]ODQ90315.1 two-component sensor histidine kinase [Mycolicibacterium flavescens]
MTRRLTSLRGVSARSAFAAATVVLVAFGLAGTAFAVVLYRIMLASVDSAAADRVAAIAEAVEAGGPGSVDPALLAVDQRIVAVQVIREDGAVVLRSVSAPAAPMVPLDDIDDGLHIAMPQDTTPFGAIRLSAQTVDAAGGRFTVLVGEDASTVASTVRTVVVALMVAGPIVVLVSAAATYLLVRRSMRSVDEIRSRVADITTSDLTERVPVPDSGDEIAALAVTMNEMLARIEAGHAAQRRFVGDASHELRSPLTTIVSALEVATAHPELLTEELATTTLIPEVQRMKVLVDDLLLLARADERMLSTQRDDIDLDDVAAAEAERLRRETTLDVKATIVPVRVVGDAEALSRVLRNLLDNAARHARTAVEVRVIRSGSAAVLTVSDDGPGIPEQDRLRVFDRFVRLDPDRSRSRGGAGLGLAIVREIVAAHRGTATIAGRPGGGATVIVELPIS